MKIVLYIIAGLVMLFFLFQFFMIFKMRFKKGKPAPQLGGQFKNAVDKYEKVLFYFHSPGCHACKPMTPVMNELDRRNKNYFCIDISRDFEMARKFGVMATPSTVIIEKGKIKDILMGPQKKEKLVELMNSSGH